MLGLYIPPSPTALDWRRLSIIWKDIAFTHVSYSTLFKHFIRVWSFCYHTIIFFLMTVFMFSGVGHRWGLDFHPPWWYCTWGGGKKCRYFPQIVRLYITSSGMVAILMICWWCGMGMAPLRKILLSILMTISVIYNWPFVHIAWALTSWTSPWVGIQRLGPYTTAMLGQYNTSCH